MDLQWPLIIFTLLLCMSGGMMGFQGWLALKGQGTRKFHLIASLAGLVALGVGGFASFLHLQHWERIFNGFGHITSGITHEMIAVVVMALVFVIELGILWKNRENGEEGQVLPKALAVVAVVVALLLGFVCAHSYDMYARPAWGNFALYLYYYASELILGATGLWLVASVTKQDLGINRKLALASAVAGAVSAVVTIACVLYISTIDVPTVGIAFYTIDPTAPAADPAGTLSSPLSGANAPLFWLGVVIIGSLVPALAGFLAAKKEGLASAAALPALAVICALAGGICYRVILYVVAIAGYVYF
ncbi:DMSO reductase anchor subunit (DmsC) [Slackia heliotrinireducens]|uniref:DMSO reductase anchor subunit n=1 Tax=Slackia heliotrinireducens (strain ATCC 29202 / DSM 20476 / NCTC 11029 / RHS 1) TaxID=471855 RepID=C7N3T2_SLAHD|nr:DmsC/YnfH family molybdoenzyme membrane anchor subunit [Slackia heliotrinireducens]ACV21673.1 DMSO reductase anchor subunit [Slackia heliotrinireducens DSM 20476]VEG99287.1 DMSO reductase anchor subunit (DmsC) [Slackia heliotrinireducens]